MKLCRLNEPEVIGHFVQMIHAYSHMTNKNILAEFEQYLFKYKHWPRAAQNGKGLAGKQGIGYSSQ